MSGKARAGIAVYVSRELEQACEDVEKCAMLQNTILEHSGDDFQSAIVVVPCVVRSLRIGQPLPYICEQIWLAPTNIHDLCQGIVHTYMNDSKINEQEKNVFCCLFLVVALARRPLRPDELFYILARVSHSQIYSRPTEYSTVEIQYDPAWKHIQQISSGLINLEKDESTDIYVVVFSRGAIHDYFLQTEGIQQLLECFGPQKSATLSRAEYWMAKKCRDTLGEAMANHGSSQPPALLAYAITYLFDHIQAIDPEDLGEDWLAHLLGYPDQDIVEDISNLIEQQPDLFREVMESDPSNLCLETRSILHVAAAKGLPDLVDSAIRLSCPTLDINATDHSGRTPLHWAALSGHVEIYERLKSFAVSFNAKKSIWEARKSLKLDARDAEGNTPLMLASVSGNASFVKVLLEAGAKVDLTYREDKATALLMAVEDVRPDVARLLMNWKANVKAKDYNMDGPLPKALLGGLVNSQSEIEKEEMLAIFLDILAESGDELFHQNKDGISPLMIMLEYDRDLDILPTVLDEEYDPHGVFAPNTKDKEGKTWLLHAAAVRASPNVINYLLDIPGTEPKVKDKKQLKAFDYAEQRLIYVQSMMDAVDGSADEHSDLQLSLEQEEQDATTVLELLDRAERFGSTVRA